MSVLSAVVERRVVPVIVLDDVADAEPLADALVAGGLPVAEVTFRTAVAPAVLRALSDRLLVGAGTVVNAAQVDEAASAGARFVVSPGLSVDVVRRCRELRLPVIPGVATATELMAALDLGIDLVKFFPAEPAGGVATLRSLGGPFPGVRFMPTGGIGPAQLADYLAHPAVAAVGGSWMVAPSLIARGDFAEVTRLTREALT